jgi:putative nucleotidyltransferase with HDIG domain
MQHGDFLAHAPSTGPRLRLASYLRDNRVVVAKFIIEKLTAANTVDGHIDLFARTLVGALARAIEEADPDVVIHWALTARSAQPPALITAAVSLACSVVAEFDLDGVHIEPSVLVFLELTKTRTAEVVGSPDRRHDDRPVIDAMLAMLRARDEATCEHSRATGIWCRRLCEALGLDQATTELVVTGGVLHDIGKISTPDAILLKNGPLTGTEWDVMRMHSAYGADILFEIPSLARYAAIVRAHHERIDGTGYPYGLKGDEIPFEARVVAVADAFHAMISDRPYRPAMTAGAAMGVLREGRNTYWNAAIVDAMVAVVASARAEAANIDALVT